MDILIVDDERTASAIHAAYVRKLGNCKAVCFGDARDALDWSATHDPAIVIVDYLMPAMNGAEFTRRFRQLRGKNKIPVVMVTGFGDEDVRQAARSAGVDAFLTKPADRIQLSACILNATAGRTVSQAQSAIARQSGVFEEIDTAELAKILAERDRMRAVGNEDESSSELDTQDLVATAPVASPGSNQILILDDERTSMAMLDYHVRKLKCVPARFSHPQQALAWCETHGPCAVIVDYMLPDMDGLEFTRLFRLLPGKADTPILMVSAYANRAVKQSAHDLGVNEVLDKPIDVAALTAHLQAVIAARALHRRMPKHGVRP